MSIHSLAIRYFDAVRRAGSIREAARHLNVASSAVNRQILKLEAELGMPLFERLPGGLKLSAAGEVLTRHVATVLRDAAQTQAAFDALKGVRSGQVDVIAAESLVADYLPTVINNMLTKHEKMRIKVLVEGSVNLPAAIVNGDVDVGIGFSIPRSPELRELAVHQFRLGAVMPPTHPLAERSSLKIADCADYPLIMSDPQLSIQTLMHPAIAHASRTITPTIEANSISLMKNLVERNLGIAFMSRIGLESAIANRLLVHIPIEEHGPLYTELGIYVRANGGLPPALKAFTEFAIAEIEQRAREELA